MLGAQLVVVNTVHDGLINIGQGRLGEQYFARALAQMLLRSGSIRKCARTFQDDIHTQVLPRQRVNLGVTQQGYGVPVHAKLFGITLKRKRKRPWVES